VDLASLGAALESVRDEDLGEIQIDLRIEGDGSQQAKPWMPCGRPAVSCSWRSQRRGSLGFWSSHRPTGARRLWLR